MQKQKVSLLQKFLRLFLYKTPIEIAITNGHVPLWLTGSFDFISFPEAVRKRWEKCRRIQHGCLFLGIAIVYVLFTGRLTAHSTVADWMFAMAGAYGLRCFLKARPFRAVPAYSYHERLDSLQQFMETFFYYPTPNFGTSSRERIVSECRKKAERHLAAVVWHGEKMLNSNVVFEEQLTKLIEVASKVEITIDRTRLYEEARQFVTTWNERGTTSEEIGNLVDV